MEYRKVIFNINMSGFKGNDGVFADILLHWDGTEAMAVVKCYKGLEEIRRKKFIFPSDYKDEEAVVSAIKDILEDMDLTYVENKKTCHNISYYMLDLSAKGGFLENFILEDGVCYRDGEEEIRTPAMYKKTYGEMLKLIDMLLKQTSNEGIL